MKQEIFETLLKAATTARQNSHSPISDFKVGAAIVTKTGSIYSGTNTEDPAFNSTIHAEQACIAQMITKEGAQEIIGVVVVGGKETDTMICSPCGHCRQLLVEFAGDDTEIIVTGPKGDIRLETTLGTLLPYPFRLSNFK